MGRTRFWGFLKRTRQITVPYLSRISGVSVSAIWVDIKLLQSMLRADAKGVQASQGCAQEVTTFPIKVVTYDCRI
ncbi:MAG: HTH domain-containing protein [Thaumarchaeota archaeon]|nr:HTH domain-containing protein [Nitrososphaerota archaeon]